MVASLGHIFSVERLVVSLPALHSHRYGVRETTRGSTELAAVARNARHGAVWLARRRVVATNDGGSTQRVCSDRVVADLRIESVSPWPAMD